MTARLRADRLLVERGVFSSRAKAQAAIAAGLVTANAALVQKASDEIPVDAELSARAEHPWVSRAGATIMGALLLGVAALQNMSGWRTILFGEGPSLRGRRWQLCFQSIDLRAP